MSCFWLRKNPTPERYTPPPESGQCKQQKNYITLSFLAALNLLVFRAFCQKGCNPGGIRIRFVLDTVVTMSCRIRRTSGIKKEMPLATGGTRGAIEERWEKKQ